MGVGRGHDKTIHFVVDEITSWNVKYINGNEIVILFVRKKKFLFIRCIQTFCFAKIHSLISADDIHRLGRCFFPDQKNFESNFFLVY